MSMPFHVFLCFLALTTLGKNFILYFSFLFKLSLMIAQRDIVWDIKMDLNINMLAVNITF